MSETRQEYVVRILTNAAVDTFALDLYLDGEWDELALFDPWLMHKPLGFAPPVLVPGGAGFRVSACPARIVATTAQLDDEDFNRYIRWLRLHISHHVLLYDVPIDDLEAAVSSAIYDDAQLVGGPEADALLAVAARVQFELLDRRQP